MVKPGQGRGGIDAGLGIKQVRRGDVAQHLTVKRSPEQAEIDRLRSRAEHAKPELAKTKAALEVVGKAHALLELLSESADTTARSRP